MDKRYQVFISSTFIDLREERDIAVQTLMGLDCIPAGMELFPAADLEQFEYIKKVIDECDYYLLIIGGKYGSATEEGVSYTEKEYDYALSQGKKVMAFLHQSPEELPLSKSETNEVAISKLKEFRATVSDGRLVEFWENKDQLAGKIALTLPKTIKLFPAIGWVRANKLPSNEVLTELNEIKNENVKLQEKLKTLTAQDDVNSKELASLNDSVVIAGTYPILDPERPFIPSKKSNFTIKVNIESIFKKLAPKIEDSLFEDSCINSIDSTIKALVSNQHSDLANLSLVNIEYDKDICLRFKYHFISLGLISISKAQSKGGDYLMYWSLTELGKKALTNYLSFKVSDIENQ